MRQALVERVLTLLRGDEGVRPHAYDDATGKRVRAPVGRLTIGVGIDLDQGLDAYEIDLLERHRLHREVLALEHKASSLAPRPVTPSLLPDDAQVALACMAFQIGGAGVAEFHRMLSAVAAGRWGQAADEALDSAWARQTPRRAAEVAALLRRSGGQAATSADAPEGSAAAIRYSDATNPAPASRTAPKSPNTAEPGHQAGGIEHTGLPGSTG